MPHAGDPARTPGLPWGRIGWTALGLHAVWEFGQCVLLYDMWDQGVLLASAWMWAAILGDVAITWGIVWLARRALGDRRLRRMDLGGWLGMLAIGAAAGTGLEWLALRAGLWSYGPHMPAVALAGQRLGLSPLLQMTLLPAASVRLAARRRPAGAGPPA